MKPIINFLEAIVAYSFYGFFAILPIRVASTLGALLTRTVGPWLSVDKVARNNLKQAMPELSPNDIDRIVKGMWNNLGRTVGEFPHMRRLNKKRFDRHVTVKGTDIFDKVHKDGKQIIFFSGHIANWEIAPKTTAMFGVPLSLVYRRANNPWIDHLINFTRDGYQSEKIPKGTVGARYLIKALKAKRSIGMLMDQKMNDGIAVPFFGRDAMTAPAIANLARRTDCLVVPVQVVRKKGVSFEVTIHPPIEIPKDGDEEKDIHTIMCTINSLLEDWIRQHLEQWFWVHKRWPKK